LLYEDDGNHSTIAGRVDGDANGLNDARRVLTLRLASGSRMLARRKIDVKLRETVHSVEFDGRPVEVSF